MRKTHDILFGVITAACALTALAVLFGLVFVIARRGWPAHAKRPRRKHDHL